MREIVEREMPNPLSRVRTSSSTLRVGTSSTPGRADHDVQGLVDPPAGRARDGKNKPVRDLGMVRLVSSAVVTTVLECLPLRQSVRLLVRS